MKLFEKHKVDFEVLGDLTYEDVKEMGVLEIGPRRKVFREITRWREERDMKKEQAIRSKMAAQESALDFPNDPQMSVIAKLKSMAGLP